MCSQGEDAFNLVVLYTGFLAGALIVIVSSLFLFMDLTLRPESLRKYKVQPETNEPVEWPKLKRVKTFITQIHLQKHKIKSSSVTLLSLRTTKHHLLGREKMTFPLEHV